MDKHVILLLLVIALFFQGCKSKSEGNASTESINIKLDLEKEMKSIHEIDLINDVEIINLDCDEVIIGEINKVIRFGSILYLMDKFQNKSIYLFDVNGKYISSISNYGNGPEEYIQLTDIFIDSDDSTLNVLSRIDNKLLKYDQKGEKLLSIKKTPKSFTSMQKIPNGYVGYVSNWIQDLDEPFNVWLMDENLEITEHYFEIDKILQNRNHADGYVFSQYNDTCYYITPIDYNIYVANNDYVGKKYLYDLSKYQITDNMKAEMLDDEKRLELINKYVYRFYNFQETKMHLIVHFIFRGQEIVAVYNKMTKNTEVVKLNPYEGKYFIPFGKIVSFDQKTIFTTIGASNLERIWKGKDAHNNFEEKYPTQIDNLRKKIKSIREDGNPFLVLYSIN